MAKLVFKYSSLSVVLYFYITRNNAAATPVYLIAAFSASELDFFQSRLIVATQKFDS